MRWNSSRSWASRPRWCCALPGPARTTSPNFFKLSTPLDLLRFSPLPFPNCLRLGLLALRARRVKDWRALEDRTAADRLREMGGERVYRVVWEPLLRGKFGDLGCGSPSPPPSPARQAMSGPSTGSPPGSRSLWRLPQRAIAFALTVHAVLWVSSTAAGLPWLLAHAASARGGIPPGARPNLRGNNDPAGDLEGAPVRAIGMRAALRRIADFGRDRKMRPHRAAPEVSAT